MRDHSTTIIMASNKVIGDCPILQAECEAIHQAILMATQMDTDYIHSDSQLVVNIINGRIAVPKEIINLVEDITSLLLYFKETRIEYCSRIINRDADTLAKRAHI